MSEFKEWRLASGYTYDKRQEQAWSAATRVERERCATSCDLIAEKFEQLSEDQAELDYSLASLTAKHRAIGAKDSAAAIREGE